MDTMCFTVQGKNGEKPLELNYERVFAIGYAGRNIEKTMEHIKELERHRRKYRPFSSVAITF